MRKLALPAAALLFALAGCHRAAPNPGLEGDAGTSAAAASGLSHSGHVASEVPREPARSSAPAASAARAGGAPDETSTASTGNAAAIMGAAPSTISDRSITAGVNAALAADKELHPLKIDVDTENGIVTLSGLAPTVSAKAHADEVARTVQGVVSVNNQLTLQSG